MNIHNAITVWNNNNGNLSIYLLRRVFTVDSIVLLLTLNLVLTLKEQRYKMFVKEHGLAIALFFCG